MTPSRATRRRVPRRRGDADPAQRRQQPAGQSARVRAQRRVGGDRHVREQRDRCVGVAAHLPASAAASIIPTCGETDAKPRCASGELVAAERLPGGVVDPAVRASGALSGPGGRRSGRISRRAAGGGQDARSASSIASAASSSSVITSSAVRALVLVDPDAAGHRRDRGVEQELAVRSSASSRALASPSARLTMSIAPRTDDPIRTAGCDAAAAGDRDGDRDDRRSTPVWRAHDLALLLLVEVADRDPAHAVGDRLAHTRGADRVERIHRGDQHEAVGRRDPSEPRERDLALGHRGDQDVQRLLGDPVELLQVQQLARPHRVASGPSVHACGV